MINLVNWNFDRIFIFLFRFKLDGFYQNLFSAKLLINLIFGFQCLLGCLKLYYFNFDVVYLWDNLLLMSSSDGMRARLALSQP